MTASFFNFKAAFANKLDLDNESDDKAYFILNLFNSEYTTLALEDQALKVHHVASRAASQAARQYPVRVAARTVQTTANTARTTAKYVAQQQQKVGTSAYNAQFAARVQASKRLKEFADRIVPNPTK